MIRSILTLQLLLITSSGFSQIFINEASNKNGSLLYTVTQETPDWIEIYNANGTPTNLLGYGISDKRSTPLKWVFPNTILGASSFMTILASGNNFFPKIDHYETAVFPTDSWKYLIPTASTATNWHTPLFDASSWTTASLGIGYGDGDDITTITNPSTSIYTRLQFTITDTSKIETTFLDIDFDDGFVAYLNGIEIARSGLTSSPPLWNDLSSEHEANIYQGNSITQFIIDKATANLALKNGVNVLSIEVHNSNPGSSDLTLIPYLSFGIKNATTLFSGTIHPYFNATTSGLFETNFTIKSEGETLYLSNPSGTIIDSLVVPYMDANMSFGKLTDGTPTGFLFQTPTPGASNNTATGYAGFELKPVITFRGGFYNGPITTNAVNNSITGGILRYSTDGEIPNINSPIYTDPITLNANTVLKVRCFSSNPLILPSASATESYFFLDDYSLPVIAISIDSVDLYGASGIFDNSWSDWKKPCFMEYYDVDGLKLFESKSSIKPDGGAGGSRSNPQHSVTLEPANSTFGEGTPINYPLIPEKPFIDKYYSFYLRNGSNYWNQYPQKDATFMRMMGETHTPHQAYTPVIVYVNGEYFGVYELREKTKASYYENNYGNNQDSLDLLAMSYFYGPGILRVSQGSDTGFYNMKNFVSTYPASSPDYFDKSNSKLDLYNFSDYIVGENWFANTDWIYNNMKISRTRTNGNKWRFGLQDMELGLAGWSDENTNIFDFFRYNNQPNPFWSIYDGLIQNPEFKNYFINRYADLMNTIFQPSSFTPLVNTMYTQLLPELPKHFQKWTGDIAGGMATYSAIRNQMLNQFTLRNGSVRNQIVSEYALVKQVDVTLNVSPAGAGYIKISTIVPMTLPWTGVYFDGNPVVITAVANPGFVFNSWIGNSIIPVDSLGNISLNMNINVDENFTALFSGISVPLALTISEINYNCDSSINGGNWIELHNYSNSPVSLGNWKLKSKRNWDNYVLPISTTIPANGYLVICENTTLFNQVYPTVTNYIGSTSFEWSDAKDSIKLYNALGQLKLSAFYSDSIQYPECADGWGRTLELKTNTSSLIDANSWFCGCIKGSPGYAYMSCNEAIYFTEINYNSIPSPYNAGDWVEIKNNTSTTINLANYTFKDANNSYTLPSVTIAPNQYLVLSNALTIFNAQHPEVSNVLSSFTFGLSNSEVLKLYDNNGKIITSVLYYANNGWPTTPSVGNYSLEYIDTLGYINPNISNSWFESCISGSPGRAYRDCKFQIVEDNLTGNLGIYPNPTQSDLNIVIKNNNESGAYELSIIDLDGRRISFVKFSSDEEFIHTSLNVEHIAAGMYFLQMIHNDKSEQQSFVKF
jgi:hypothetical protein